MFHHLFNTELERKQNPFAFIAYVFLSYDFDLNHVSVDKYSLYQFILAIDFVTQAFGLS